MKSASRSQTGWLTAVFLGVGYAVGVATPCAASMLNDQATEELRQCLEKSVPSICFDREAPAGSQMLEKCAVSVCKESPTPASTAAPKIADALQAVRDAVAGEVKEVTDLQDVAAQFDNQASVAIDRIRKGQEVEAAPWDVEADANPVVPAYKVLTKACTSTAPISDACRRVADGTMALRLGGELVHRLVRVVNWPALQASVACSGLLVQRYNAYFDDAARFQWPWEVGINSALYNRDAKRDSPICEGFRNVPSRQVLFLHPSLGFRYSENAQQKLDGVVLLEVLGLRRWIWKEGAASNMRGGSILFSYGTQKDAGSAGWGVLFHVKDDVSIGIVRTHSHVDNRTSLIVSYDFGKLFQSDRSAACKKLFSGQLCDALK